MRRASAAALLAVAAFVAWLTVAGQRRDAHSQRTPEAAAAPAASGAAATATAEPNPPLPESLRGSDPDGALRVDADGHFVPGRDALALFDYFYAASGEEPEARIRERIRAEIERRLEPPASAEAEAFFAQYLGYREGARELYAGDLSFLDDERRSQRIRELRREVFGAALAEQLFGAEEQSVRVDLEARRVAQDRELTPEQREQRIAELEAQLPEPERVAREQARAVISLREAEQALRAAGADDAAIRAERERRFGPAAAERLAALDARRAEWDARVAAYRAERDALRASQLPPEELAAALTRLRDSRFAGGERMRIQALEAAEPAQPAPGSP